MKFGLTGLLLSAWGVEEDCLKLPVRLWLHQDATGSYTKLVSDPHAYATQLLDALNEKLEDFDFGGSLFRDRLCEKQGGCFNQGVTFGGSYSSKVSEFAEFMKGQIFAGGGDAPEDTLSAIPYVAKQHFGSLDGEQIRIFLIVTDYKGKYHGQPNEGDMYSYESDSAVENPDPESAVSCDEDVWYPTVEQLSKSIATYRLVPVVVAAGKSGDWWRKFFVEQLGLSESTGEFAVYPVSNTVESIAEGVINSVNDVSCIVVSTSTTAAPTPTTATATTATATTATATTATATTATATTATATATSTTAGDHKKKNAVIAASAAAGAAAALAAVGAAYRLRGGPPELDVEEEAAAAEEGAGGQRESIIAMEEDEYI
ncbi:hypothetical protein GNI_030200 [Gregarina niphandrodes]|uniref:Uncharacterized protein n=1 Tax=Gregarina niphandrodes TaxID=110365 RepID=A0A023BB14_GRENI|nr:hypothetical protein GNI_030200 [Gregarina niphandrodes]EZG79013.1 hypothetical protein GNI_030200 [Gregarina niphandrodes]|eukprot:XP_011129144.1 hypothetical protein GNI_030200 [Gregarina niphandrodes]